MAEEKKETAKVEEKNTEVKEESKKEVAPEKKDSKKSESAVEKVGKSKKKEEKKVELEREYVVPLRRGFLNVPQYKRAKRAVRTLKEFIARHMKIRDRDLSKVKIDINLNNEIWFRGIKKPLHKVKVKAKKVGDEVFVSLAEVPKVVEYKIAREAKRKAAAIADKPKEAKKKDKAEAADKDGDGVEDKKEEKEDKKSVEEKAVKEAKVEAKEIKHTTGGAHVQKTAPVRKVLK